MSNGQAQTTVSPKEAAAAKVNRIETQQRWLRKATKVCFAVGAAASIITTVRLAEVPPNPTSVLVDQLSTDRRNLEQFKLESPTIDQSAETRAKANQPTNFVSVLDPSFRDHFGITGAADILNRSEALYRRQYADLIGFYDRSIKQLERSPEYRAYSAQRNHVMAIPLGVAAAAFILGFSLPAFNTTVLEGRARRARTDHARLSSGQDPVPSVTP
jgi:hypothetical protein